MRAASGIWTEPVQGGYPDPRMFLSLSGLEQLRAFIHGQAPAPPMSHLTGMRPTQVGPGTATFSMPVTGWLLSPPGLLQLGTLAILADGSLGCAVQTALAAATPYTTAEMSITGTRPVHPGMQRLVARGGLIHASRSLALSDVRIEDEQGRLVAASIPNATFVPLETNNHVLSAEEPAFAKFVDGVKEFLAGRD